MPFSNMLEKSEVSASGKRDERPTCLDIFCGAGGTTYGAMQAGLHVAYGLDRDASAVKTFAANHPGAYADCRDVAGVTAEEILRLAKVDEVDYLLSGPNCQGVSQMGLFWKDDPRNLMFVHLARLLDEFIFLGKAPKNVIIENVPSIAFKKNIRIVQDLVRFFIDREYLCAADVVNFVTWGLPQLRHRFILIATRTGEQPRLPAPIASLDTGDGLVTAWDAISDLSNLPPVPAGQIIKAQYSDNLTDYQRLMRSNIGVIHNHHAGRTADIDIERIKMVPPGGCWKDIPSNLLPERFKKVRMTDYKTLYGRMLKEHPAYTIYAAYGNVTSGCFTHPEHDRPITVREGCRLQGFPDDFVVAGSVSSQYSQIGNAVPALAASILIRHWQSVLDGADPVSVPMRLDEEMLFKRIPLKLPVLTPRYLRIGYGTGTYWPKGWGDRPEEMPNTSKDYRISIEPINYRRIGWRTQRDELMTESICQLAHLDWSELLNVVSRRSNLTLMLDGIDTSETGASGGKDLARRRFMRYLAPTGAAIATIAENRGNVIVHCDFGLTSTWLQKFIAYLAEEQGLSIQIVSDQDGKKKVKNSENQVFFTSKPVIRGASRTLILAHPFTGLNGFDRNGTKTLPFPDQSVRATLLEKYPFE